MFTLIAIGVGSAFLYSAVVMVAPNLFPAGMRHHGMIGVYFEAAAMITVLVLLGQVLELRARSRTGAAIRGCSISRRRLLAVSATAGGRRADRAHPRGRSAAHPDPARRCRSTE
jgi:cation transport ATPase